MTFPVEPNDIGFYFLIISQGTLDAPDGIHPHVHIRTAYLPQIDLLKLETDPAQMASRRRGKPLNVYDNQCHSIQGYVCSTRTVNPQVNSVIRLSSSAL